MKNIVFFVRHFFERGTEVAIYDYAHFNETILGNKSYIAYFSDKTQTALGWYPNVKNSFSKFQARFQMFELDSINDITKFIDEYNIDYFHTLTHGMYEDTYQFENKNIWKNCKTIKHAVFEPLGPQGDFYCTISNALNVRYNTKVFVFPHMVYLPDINEDLREQLNIPKDALVIGRHGGLDSFNIEFVKEAIIEVATSNPNIYFVFMNTIQFNYDMPNIKYLPCTVDLQEKTKFINTCDYMIHAQNLGETFGLCCGEFAIRNKPVITYSKGQNRAHLDMLGDKAILYENKEDLVNIFTNPPKVDMTFTGYKLYNPNNVIKIFDYILSMTHKN
jgi:hypothetical protein